MGNCVGFLEHAAIGCGLDVGFGKMILLYADATPVAVANLNATAINAAIADGTIKGIIKGWHTVTGASIAETNVERPGSAEMKQIRSEILADTLMFENTLANNEVIADLVKAGSLYGLLIDDEGNVFGELNSTAGYVKPMLMNFSGKTTTSFQKDQTSDKSVSVTVRYLVKEVQAVVAGIEVEEILSKTLLVGQLVSVTTLTATSMVFDMLIKDKTTGLAFADAIIADNLAITGANISLIAASYVPLTGVLTVTLTGTGFFVDQQTLNVTISGSDFYMKSTKVAVKLGE